MSWVERLSQAAASGETIDLSRILPADPSAEPADRDQTSARRIPAEDIRAVLLNPSLVADPAGLRIRGAFVSGTLDLDHSRLTCRLVFQNCLFENALSVDHGTLRGLELSNVILRSLSMKSARVEGDCLLMRLRVSGGLMLGQIQVWGDLRLDHAELGNTAGPALMLDGANITGSVNLDGVEATGEVRGHGARINGQLLLSRAKLRNAGRTALLLDASKIGAGAYLNDLEAAGSIRLCNAEINSHLSLASAVIGEAHPNGTLVNLKGADIVGDIDMSNLKATGTIYASGLHVNGQLDLQGAKLSNPNGYVLVLDDAEITQAFMSEVETIGAFLIRNARIKGLNLQKAKLNDPQNALCLDGSEISDLFLDEVEATGRVRGVGLQVKNLVLIDAKLENPGHEAALTFEAAQVSSGLLMNRISAIGGVGLHGSKIELLDMTEAKFSTQEEKDVVVLSAAMVDTLILAEASFVGGSIRLDKATFGLLHVGNKKPAGGLPPLSDAHGLAVSSLGGFLRTDVKSARDWLDTIPAKGKRDFAAQPWREFAKVYDEQGQPEDGRRLRFWASQRLTRVAPFPSRLIRHLYGVLVGHGYYPALVLWWLTCLWLTAAVLSSLLAYSFTPTDLRVASIEVVNGTKKEVVRVDGNAASPPNYPSFSALLYAVDTAIPAAATGQATAWRVTENTWLAVILAVIKGAGWILTALLLAGVTGLLRKN